MHIEELTTNYSHLDEVKTIYFVNENEDGLQELDGLQEFEELVSESFRLLNSSLHLFEQYTLEEAHFAIHPKEEFETLIGQETLEQ